MDTQLLQSVLQAYGLNEESTKVISFGTGIINRTWKVTTPDHEFILQQINTDVFQYPQSIADNTRLLADFLKKHHPGYTFVAPIPALNGAEMVRLEERFFRLFPFVVDSHSIDVVGSPEEAYEAAQQFGRFTRLLSRFDSSNLKITIPDFHNLTLRYQQFLQALIHSNQKRVTEATCLIKILLGYDNIVTEYVKIRSNATFMLRVTHHDTKISNVLFDSKNKGLCVIDLDTVMPGFFISDVGDMMRTYLSPVSEEECDFTKIQVRPDYYKAIVKGYQSEMNDELTATEKGYFFYAGEFMIYMQALRFLTDHLNDDLYYGAAYKGHNYNRAMNQVVLLQRLKEQRNFLVSTTAH
jgi:Ser/Thr protein kinase RdoA (MazF antagonist)